VRTLGCKGAAEACLANIEVSVAHPIHAAADDSGNARRSPCEKPAVMHDNRFAITGKRKLLNSPAGFEANFPHSRRTDEINGAVCGGVNDLARRFRYG